MLNVKKQDQDSQNDHRIEGNSSIKMKTEEDKAKEGKKKLKKEAKRSDMGYIADLAHIK